LLASPPTSAPHGGGCGGGALRHAGAVPRLPPRRRRGVLRARIHGRGKYLCSPFRIGLRFGSVFGVNCSFAAMQGVPYPTCEAVPAVALPTVPEGKGKGKGGGASPEKGSSGAPSGEDASRRYGLSLLPCQRSFKFLFSPFLSLVKSSSNPVACVAMTAAAMSHRRLEMMTLTIRYQTTCCATRDHF
jgi:hypothetical protein